MNVEHPAFNIENRMINTYVRLLNSKLDVGSSMLEVLLNRETKQYLWDASDFFLFFFTELGWGYPEFQQKNLVEISFGAEAYGLSDFLDCHLSFT